MPLVGPALKAKFKDSIMAGLKKEFGGTGDHEPSWEKIASAISEIAVDIVDAMHNDAQVAPGIPTAGSPAAQVTVGPGKIL